MESLEEQDKFFSRYLANIIMSKYFAVFLNRQEYCIALELWYFEGDFYFLDNGFLRVQSLWVWFPAACGVKRVVAMKICDFRATHLNTPSACGGDDLFRLESSGSDCPMGMSIREKGVNPSYTLGRSGDRIKSVQVIGITRIRKRQQSGGNRPFTSD